MRLRASMNVGGLILILAGVGIWIWGQFDGPVGESIASSALAVVIIGVILLTRASRTRPCPDTEEAYKLGYDLGYEAGYNDGHDASRPTVVSICDAPSTGRAGPQARTRDCRSWEGDHA